MKDQYLLSTLENIKQALIVREATIAVAESVTSGHLQVAFSQAKEASSFFQGGITVYNAGQKTRHLGVEPICALKTNCVSQKIADEMALHVNQLFLSHYAIGITGYAATMPENHIHELFAFVSIAYRDEIIRHLKLEGDKNQDSYDVQLHYTREALKELESVLTIHPAG